MCVNPMRVLPCQSAPYISRLNHLLPPLSGAGFRMEKYVTGFSENAIAGRDALHAFSLLHTRDLDEARAGVARVLSPHELRMSRSSDRLDAQLCHAPIGAVSINRLRYGATVQIDAGCTNDFLLVMMPLSGVSEVCCGDDSIRSTPKVASVVSPTLPLRMTSRYDCDQIMIRIERAFLERHCMQHLGRELRRPIEFRLGMDVSEGHAASWCALVRYLVSELDRESNVFTSALTRVHVEHLVVSTLLLAQPHSYRDDLMNVGRSVAPAYIRRVEEYIEAHADEPLSIADLAACAGVSASTLFAGFREFRDTSPIAFLKGVRMKRVRDELRAASPQTGTVTDVAMRWGFSHLGRFAVEYRRWFGESPSQTLKH